ncbi:hypothetical protein [Yoonia sp. BS5-3]|uniref:Autotransporter outer membrane beta-barrel domain-containing protein n=1 Tax=Yoonia phaeophyticola TaxID=3137369 RepID=A0ABZ2V296_9RHOB
MRMQKNPTLRATLMSATALAWMALPAQAQELDCVETLGQPLPENCEQRNAGLVVEMPIGQQTEFDTGPITNNAGFVLAIDGAPINADPRIEDQIRRTDIALAEANVQVMFDGLDPQPRLNVETAGAPRAYRAGDTVTLRSETNYPAFIDRAEMRIIDRAAAGGARLVARVPVDANGNVSFVVPEGRDLVVVHRVYDAAGRYDQTEPLPLGRADDRGLTAADDGFDFTAERNLRINGGTVRVAADSLQPGATLSTLGETVRPDRGGRLVIERILPPGDYAVDVAVNGNGANTNLSREVQVPGAEWFTFGVADLMLSRTEDDATGETVDTATGRLQYYIDGETAGGLQITSSLDTGEEELRDIFRRLDERDPRSIIGDIEDSYLTYGDDSEIVDNTPTSGKFYLRVEQDGNFALWGDYQARVAGSGYLRNERTLYGAQGHYATDATTERGEARASVDLYASQPDQLVGRDTFLGTGGSVYFLQRQAITTGTETLSVEVRDADTGRVTARQTLVQGRDYDINYTQGSITLYSPLSSSTVGNLIETNPGGDAEVYLVAQYEFTPTTADVDGFSTGGRVEGWVSDDVRVGVTGLQDDTGTADQTAVAADLRYEYGENSFVQLDYAESDGPGYGSSVSTDGGLTIDNTAAVAGSGTAAKIEGQLDFGDLGSERGGVLGGYYEERSAGFSTLDYQVAADETLYGVYVRSTPEEGLGYAVYADVYDSDAGVEKQEIGAELSGAITQQLSYAVGVEYLDEVTATTSGDRVVAAGRLTYALSEQTSIYGFGQQTIENSGLDAYDRYGLGVVQSVSNGWAITGELSDGTGGVGGRILAERRSDSNNSTYFGYELDPGRALDAGISTADNGGKYVLGGRRQISDDTQVFAENTYDIFGSARTLTGAYGVEYLASDFLTYDAALELGQVEDDINGDFDRRAVSFGVRYASQSVTARARLEYRQDEADDLSVRSDADTVIVTTDLQYQIDDARRVLFSLDLADTDTDESAILDGTLADLRLGYALRPVSHERVNILAGYRYLYDMFGQEVDGVAGSGPVQESHIVDIAGNYDINRHWTIGAKLGARLTDSAADSTMELTSNDAWLGVINARYNVVHNWDALIELRHLETIDAETSDTGVLAAVYRHFGNNAKVGVGYNFASFSDDLSDLTFDDQGAFINIIAKF